MPPTTDPRAEALAWLGSQLRWERTLAELRDRAEADEPVVLAPAKAA